MSTNTGRIHPFITLRVPCVSLEYCFQTWVDNNVIDKQKEANLRKIVSGFLEEGSLSEPDFENLYLPLFCKWTLLETTLKVLVHSQLPKHCMEQYSIDFKVVPNKIFLESSHDNNQNMEDLPASNVSKFHELSFDTLQVLSKIEVSQGMRNWVSIFPIDEVRFDPFYPWGDNKQLQNFKKTVLLPKNGSSGSSLTGDYSPPRQLVTVKCPTITFNQESIENELCSRSVYTDFETCLTNKDSLRLSVIVLPKGSEDGDTDTTCIFWDVPVWVIILYNGNNEASEGKPPEVPIFTNVWEINKQLFILFNSFMRDYLHFVEERELTNGDGDKQEAQKTIQVFCKADHASDSPFFEKSVTSRLLYRSSVRKNGALLLEHLMSDHPHKRQETGEYKMETIKDKSEFIGIGLHSFHFDMEMLQHIYYKKDTAFPFLKKVSEEDYIRTGGDYIESTWNRACGTNSNSGYYPNKRKFNPNSVNPIPQQKPLFYFFFIWHYACKSDKLLSTILIVLDNRNFGANHEKQYSSKYRSTDGEVANNYEELQKLFSSQTDLSHHYLEYLLTRLVPFIIIFDDTGNVPSSKIHSIKIPVRVVVQKTYYGSGFSNIEAHLDSLLSVTGNDTESITNRLCKMPFWYNDVHGYFEHNCKPLFDILRRDKYKFSTITGCFPLDRALLNYGLIKYGHSDIFVDYNYGNILEQAKNLISISLQICKTCHIEMKEALFGSKMLWFTRLCEYLCCVNNYPKPNKMKLVGSKNRDNKFSFLSSNSAFLRTTTTETIPNTNTLQKLQTGEDIVLDEITNRMSKIHIQTNEGEWKILGGDISEALIGHYTKYDSDILTTMDFDAFYNSIICEYKLGYICYKPSAESENKKLYISNELVETFSELLNTRRRIKQLKNKTQSDLNLLNALKLVGNSIYGCVASKTCPISSDFFANFVTWIGRVTIRETRSLIQRCSPNYVVFSQTDSVCVRVKNNKELEQSENINLSFLVQEINSKLCPNSFMRLVQEESFSDLHVFNKNAYIANKENPNEKPEFFYEKIIEEILTTLESILDKEEEGEQEENQNKNQEDDEDSPFYSSLLLGHIRLTDYFVSTLYCPFERECKTKSIFTKKWPLLKKVFFMIMLFCRKMWNKPNEDTTSSPNSEVYISFLLFRMKHLVFRIFLQKHPLLLSTLFKFTNGITQIDFVSCEHFRTTFLDKSTDKNMIPFRHLIETCNFMGDFLKTLKGRGFHIPYPWSNEMENAPKEIMEHLKDHYENGWFLQTHNTDLEQKQIGYYQWWESLMFTEHVTNMNRFHLVASKFSVVVRSVIKDESDKNDPLNNISHLLQVKTLQHVSNFLDFSVFVQSLGGVDIEKALKENLIFIDSQVLTVTIPLVFKTIPNSNILFVHDLIISFDKKFTTSLYKDMTKSGHAFLQLLSIRLKYIKHISVLKQTELAYYGKFSRLLTTKTTLHCDAECSKRSIEEEMCLLLKTLHVDNN